jgi:peroxiredoxin
MRPLRTLYRIALTLLVVVCLLPAQVQALPRAGQPAPNFKVVTTSGQSVTLENYRGYVLVIDFFATWCIPCKTSIPHLVEMNRKYGKQGLHVLGLSADEDGEKDVRDFADQYHVNYPLALAGETVQADYGIRSVPVMFVVDKKGKVAEVFRGFSDELGRSMEQLIRKLLAEK